MRLGSPVSAVSSIDIKVNRAAPMAIRMLVRSPADL
jgi:hypothetical protein